MKKQQELIDALIEIKRIAGIKNIKIKEIGLPMYWLEPTEIAPNELLGIKIR